MNAAGTGAIHVAFDVDFHAIRDTGLSTCHLMEETTGADAAIHSDIEHAYERKPAVVHVKKFFVGRECKSIGVGAIGNSKLHFTAIRCQAVDALHIEIALDILRDHTGNYESTR